MTECKTAVTPLLTHWSFRSLALSHWYIHVNSYKCYKMREQRRCCSNPAIGILWTRITKPIKQRIMYQTTTPQMSFREVAKFPDSVSIVADLQYNLSHLISNTNYTTKGEILFIPATMRCPKTDFGRLPCVVKHPGTSKNVEIPSKISQNLHWRSRYLRNMDAMTLQKCFEMYLIIFFAMDSYSLQIRCLYWPFALLLTLSKLNFSEGRKIHIYILYHSSTLTRHRKLKSFLK